MPSVSNKKSLSTAMLGLKVKLRIYETGDLSSIPPDSSWFLKEKPPDAEHRVLSLTRKEENDDVSV